MTYNLNCEGFEQYLTSIHFNDIHGKITYEFRFDNEYGAIVTNHASLTWEVAVINYIDKDSDKYILDFTTDIADDVIVDVPDKGVRNILNKIKEL